MKPATDAPFRIALALTRMTPEPWLEAFRDAFAASGLPAEVVMWNGTPIGARYAIAWLPPSAFYAQERGLKAMFSLGAGVDRLLGEPDLPAEVPVIRLVDAGMAPKMAEYVCYHVARITRGLDRFGPHAGHDWSSEGPRGAPPTVGIMGLGAMGLQIAQAVSRFGYPVVGWARTPRSDAGMRTFAGFAHFEDFLAASQILVNALPLTPDTADLLDRRRLQQLPVGAWLINIGRGATIVDADLVDALDAEELGGAVLDVFRTEPLPADHPFWRHPRITVTPHLAGPTPRRPAVRQIVEDVSRLESGVAPGRLPGWVDRSRGY